ncbi:MAG: hypothetical protein EBX02_12050 [Betaproteobacteria bacterium]|nr:hypothetical protein [Betaproteobacteria bacterium]
MDMTSVLTNSVIDALLVSPSNRVHGFHQGIIVLVRMASRLFPFKALDIDTFVGIFLYKIEYIFPK